MTVQTTFTINHDIGLPGLIANSIPYSIWTKLAEDSDIGFGLVVSQGTADNQATLGGSAPVGVTVRSLARENVSDEVYYAENDAMNVIYEGHVYVEVGGDGGAPGSLVCYNTTTGAIVVNDGDVPGEGELLLDQAVLLTTTATGELGVICLNGLPFTTTEPQA